MTDTQSSDVVAVSYDDGHAVVLLRGEVDLAAGESLDRVLDEAVTADRPVVLDVREVAFMDSVGGAFVVRLAVTLADRGEKLTVRGPNRRVEDLLVLMGARQLVSWEATP